MDLRHRTAEDYFEELKDLVEKASAQYKQAVQAAAENTGSKRAELAEFIDFYCDDFNDTLVEILESIGAASESYQKEYSYEDDLYRILDTDLVLEDLSSNRELYVARIKEATVFVPHGSLAVWIENFEDLEDLAEELEDKFADANIARAD